MSVRTQDGFLPKGVDLRCECTASTFESLDKFEIANEKYAIIKDNVVITCPQCGKSQSSPDKYISKETEIPASIVRHMPECPVCRSLNVQKIGTVQKLTSFAVGGVFSSNIGKTMECKNCGCKF